MPGRRTPSYPPIGWILRNRNYGGGSSSSGRGSGSSSSGAGGSGSDSTFEEIRQAIFGGLGGVLAYVVGMGAFYLYIRSVVLFSNFLSLYYPNANSIKTIVYIIGFIIFITLCFFVKIFIKYFAKIFYYFGAMIAMYLLCAVILFSALHITDTVFNIATGHDAPPPFTVCPECPPGNFQLIDFLPKMLMKLPLEWVFIWFFTYMDWGLFEETNVRFTVGYMFIVLPFPFAFLAFLFFAYRMDPNS